MARGKLPPGPRGYLRFKNSFKPNILVALDKCWKDHGDLFVVKLLPGLKWHVALHSAMAEHILVSHGKKYQKPTVLHKPLSLFFGDGLIISEGEQWRKQRRLMQPAFHRPSLMNLASVMTNRAQQTVRDWERYPDGGEIDVLQELQQLTLQIVGETLLGADLGPSAEALKESFLHCAMFVARRTATPIKTPLWFPAESNRQFLQNREVLNRIAMDIIRSRRENGSKSNDLLSMLLEARDADTGEGMSDQELRDEIVTFMFAGHETTNITLCWAFYLLAKHPHVLLTLHEELENVLNGNAPKPEDFARLPYTRMVIEETLRLFPPAWFQPREPMMEDEIAGYRIRKRSLVIVSAFLTHRHPEFWGDPERFDPTRFTEAENAKRHKFAYYPFGGGPRICIGNQFALMEAILILATIAQRYRLDLTEKPIEMQPAYVLRPRNGLQMKLFRR